MSIQVSIYMVSIELCYHNILIFIDTIVLPASEIAPIANTKEDLNILDVIEGKYSHILF